MSIKTKCAYRSAVPGQGDGSAAGAGGWEWGRHRGSMDRTKPAVWHCQALNPAGRAPQARAQMTSVQQCQLWSFWDASCTSQPGAGCAACTQGQRKATRTWSFSTFAYFTQGVKICQDSTTACPSPACMHPEDTQHQGAVLGLPKQTYPRPPSHSRILL